MSFFWSSSYTPPKSTQIRAPTKVDIVIEKNEPDVSSRSVPITCQPSKQPNLVIDIPSIKSVSIADECTPVNSTYNSPRHDIQFEAEADFIVPDVVNSCSEPCISITTDKDTIDLHKRIHHLENLYNQGLYYHLKVVHQGIYKNNVLHGGHVASPDRDELDVNENIHLYNGNNITQDRIIDFKHKYTEIISQTRLLMDRLENITEQLNVLSIY